VFTIEYLIDDGWFYLKPFRFLALLLNLLGLGWAWLKGGGVQNSKGFIYKPFMCVKIFFYNFLSFCTCLQIECIVQQTFPFFCFSLFTFSILDFRSSHSLNHSYLQCFVEVFISKLSSYFFWECMNIVCLSKTFIENEQCRWITSFTIYYINSLVLSVCLSDDNSAQTPPFLWQNPQVAERHTLAEPAFSMAQPAGGICPSVEVLKPRSQLIS